MDKKRFIVEIGTGIDLHGADVTKAACKAVKDAISRASLIGLLEILNIQDLDTVDVDILVAVPHPAQVDLEKVKAMLPIGKKTARAVAGGMIARGICVPAFGPDNDEILVANAAVTVFVGT